MVLSPYSAHTNGIESDHATFFLISSPASPSHQGITNPKSLPWPTRSYVIWSLVISYSHYYLPLLAHCPHSGLWLVPLQDNVLLSPGLCTFLSLESSFHRCSPAASLQSILRWLWWPSDSPSCTINLKQQPCHSKSLLIIALLFFITLITTWYCILLVCLAFPSDGMDFIFFTRWVLRTYNNAWHSGHAG